MKPEDEDDSSDSELGSELDSEEELFLSSMEQLSGLSKSKLVRIKGAGAGGERGTSDGSSRSVPSRRLERRMRKRGFQPEDRIDLHGLDRRAARIALERFLTGSRASGVEILLVIHGKGRRILKQEVCSQLDRASFVVEHLSAPKRLGGGGARVVRLRRRS